MRVWVEVPGQVRPVKHVFGPQSVQGAAQAAFAAAKTHPIESWSIETEDRLVSGLGRLAFERAVAAF